MKFGVLETMQNLFRDLHRAGANQFLTLKKCMPRLKLA